MTRKELIAIIEDSTRLYLGFSISGVYGLTGLNKGQLEALAERYTRMAALKLLSGLLFAPYNRTQMILRNMPRPADYRKAEELEKAAHELWLAGKHGL